MKKRIRHSFRLPTASTPVFVLGKQRSGTTMLMDVFHARNDTEVFDERANSRAFKEYRIRGFDVVEELVTASRAPYVCFKPLADSHLALEFLARFPEGRAIWVYRHYLDNAMSSLRKWPDGRGAIRAVCTGGTDGGWFQEGVSRRTARMLQAIYTPELTEFDLACLTWWARNRLVVELELLKQPRLLLVRYEGFVEHRRKAFAELYDFLGMAADERSFQDVGAKPQRPPMDTFLDPAVKQSCDELWGLLNAHVASRPAHRS